ncbi:MAG: hypothetical protein GSR72_02870 [Desulfurococcales archaeon]|nr:hypothetical protein [Desulfurococcales archaeon]MEB3788819.1 hypothetical protein [Desulfurococcales archaeon]
MAATGQTKLLDIKRYSSVGDLIKELDAEITRLKGELGELLRRLESAKAKAEVLVKLENLLSTAGGGKLGGTEIPLGQAKAIINPTPKQEFDILVDVVRSLQNRIIALERVRKDMDPLVRLGDIDLALEVIYENGIPSRILVKM